MARETKVGLLAGLAFIICFAVILANRGRQTPPIPSDSVLTDLRIDVPNVQGAKPALTREPGSSPGRRDPARSTPAGTAVRDAGHTPPRPAPATPASGADLPEIQTATPAMDRLVNTSIGDNPPAQPAEIPNRELERVLASRSALGDANIALTPAAAPISGMVPESTNPQLPTIYRDAAPLARQETAKVASGTPYTVKASDTLSSIAAAHFGTKSHDAVNAIFDANRTVLTDPNQLKVGSVLLIPGPRMNLQTPLVPPSIPAAAAGSSLPKTTEKRKPESSQSPPTKEPKETKAPKPFRWYQVQKNDRYASIARDQLSDGSRWREIFEMNKDKFPNPQQIREGVRIKLPLNAHERSADEMKSRRAGNPRGHSAGMIAANSKETKP